MNMCHDIVPSDLLLLGSDFIINIGNIAFHFCNLLVCDAQSKLLEAINNKPLRNTFLFLIELRESTHSVINLFIQHLSS